MTKSKYGFLSLAILIVLAFSSCSMVIENSSPSAPKELIAYAESQDSVRLTWGAVSGAAEYVLYRSGSLAGDYAEIGSAKTTSFLDRNLAGNKIYYYKVAVRDKTKSAAVRCRTPSPDYDVPFWAADLRTEGGFYKTWTKRLKTGTHCIVYGEMPEYTDAPGISESDATGIAETMAKEFDDNIYTKIKDAFGDPTDVDGNGKVILLLLDVQDGYDGSVGSSYVAGFFHSNDMLQTSYSNKADMLYIDTWPANFKTAEGRAQIYSTAAHEFQHLINYSLHHGAGKLNRSMDVWVDEGLASGAEFIYGGVQQDRIKYFNNNSQSILKGNNFFVWYDDWNDPLANYSTVYLFFQWLRIHSNNGTGIYKDIISHPDYTDYRAVSEAANKRMGSLGLDFSQWEVLLRTWLAATFIVNPTGPYGYNNEDAYRNLKAPALGAGAVKGNTLQLAPGEGVFSVLSKTLSSIPSGAYGGNIKYAGIKRSPSNGTVTTEMPFTVNTGNRNEEYYLLTFNSNTKSELTDDADFEAGYVTNIELPSFSLKAEQKDSGAKLLGGEDYVPPEPYEWDGARYFFDRNRPPVPSRDRG
ncbi:MAG: hypothetical protein LBF78_09435 [Treponema sp.]|nr:hypothetical protein [Treponema sp.]